MQEYKIIEKSLKEKYPYRTELHAHTKKASTCADFEPEEVIRKYKNIGYDGIVITNHFIASNINLPKEQFLNLYFDNIDRAISEGEKIGIKVFFGAELRFHLEENCPMNDYLIYGSTKEDLHSYYDVCFTNLENFVKNYKKDYEVLIQAHPLRKNVVAREPELLDGYESFNLHPGHNAKIPLAVRLAQGKIITAGTDFHHESHEGCGAVRFKEMPKDNKDVARLLKEQDYILEIQGKIVLP